MTAGVALSVAFDLPTSPLVVLAEGALFASACLAGAFRGRRKMRKEIR